jgi:ribosomal protein S12 methylthiotransferase accessory factor
MEVADGIGRGDPESARVGAVFEALEHYLSGLDGLRNRQIRLRHAHEVAAGPLAADPLVRRLAEGPARELGCVRYHALDGSLDVDVPVFLTIPEYRGHQGEAARLRVDDFYDYATADRCVETSGWAAGSYAAEAVVHAVNEAIERDALAQLIAEQFGGEHTPPLCVVDPSTLPADLAGLLSTAVDRSGRPVHLVNMTSDVGVPAYFAFQTPESGGAPTAVGSAAGLSGHVAATRALTELIQCQTTPTTRRLPDFTAKLPDAHAVEFVGADGPTTPRRHLAMLMELLQGKGFVPYAREQYSTRNVAVVNVFVPGLDRSTDCRSLRVSRRCAQAPTG